MPPEREWHLAGSRNQAIESNKSMRTRMELQQQGDNKPKLWGHSTLEPPDIPNMWRPHLPVKLLATSWRAVRQPVGAMRTPNQLPVRTQKQNTLWAIRFLTGLQTMHRTMYRHSSEVKNHVTPCRDNPMTSHAPKDQVLRPGGHKTGLLLRNVK